MSADNTLVKVQAVAEMRNRPEDGALVIQISRHTWDCCLDVADGYMFLCSEVAVHHGQKADDRCIEDDDRLYAAAGLPPCDRRVGCQLDMIGNCVRFVRNRTEGGGPWPSYADLEAERDRLRQLVREVINGYRECRIIGGGSDLVDRLEKELSDATTPTA